MANIEMRIIVGVFSFFFGVMAFVISFGLRNRLGAVGRLKKTEERIFAWLCDLLILCCFINPLTSIMDGLSIPYIRIILTLLHTVSMSVYLIFMFLWMSFVDYKFFQSKNRMERRGKKALIPLVIMFVLLLVNIPTGIFSTVDEANRFEPHLLWHLGILYQVGCLFVTMLLVRKYRRIYGGLHFFSIKEFIIPFLIGVIFQVVMHDEIFTTVAAAIGLTGIYIGLMSEKVYIDPVTGMYNSYFLNRVFEEIKAGDYDFKSAILFKLTGKNDDDAGGIFLNMETAKAISKTIDEIMPEGCETIYMGGGELLVLTKVQIDQEAAVKLLCMMFEESLKNNGYDGFNIEHSYSFRREGQSADDFLRGLGEKREVAA